MKTTSFQRASVTAALGLFTLFLTSCATTGAKYPAAKAPSPKVVSFAVMPMNAANYSSLSAGDRGVRDFEKIYLPLRLIERLNNTSGVNGAYLTTADTPAVDFIVTGNIAKSDGLHLEIDVQMSRVDGANVLKKSYAIEHKDAREIIVKSTLQGLAQRIANDLVATALKTNISLPQARAMAYAKNPQLNTTPDIISDAQEAGNIERSEILAATTSTMTKRTPVMTPSYVEWQSISAPLVRDKLAAQRQKNMANFSQGLALLAGAASVASSYNAAQTGNTYQMQSSQQVMSQATTLMINAEANADVAQNKINQIEKTLAAFKNQFSTGAQKQITVRVFGKLMTLTGSQAEMLSQFHKGVKDDLNSRGATTSM